MNFSWTTAFKIAWREARSSSFKFLFVILAVAVGVGSLTGVRGFSRAFHEMLLSQARTLMAADLSLRVFELPNPQQDRRDGRAREKRRPAHLDHRNPHHGVRRRNRSRPCWFPSKPSTRMSIRSTARSASHRPPRSRPRSPSDTVAVSDDVLLRLNLKVGDTFRLGGQPFRIVGQVTYEPDRMLGSLNVGPRVMMTRDGSGPHRSDAARQPRRRALPVSPRTRLARHRRGSRRLKRAFPDALIADYRESHPIITQGLNRATTFLSLVSLITLIVGAIGVATAMHAHIQQRMDSIAIMKCLGARSSHLMRIYLIQTIALGLAGGLLGVAFGIAIQRTFPRFLARYFQLEPSARWDLDHRRARHRHRDSGDAALHPAASAGHPAHSSQPDPAPRNGRDQTGLARASRPKRARPLQPAQSS